MSRIRFISIAAALIILCGCLDEGEHAPSGPGNRNDPEDSLTHQARTLDAMLAVLTDSQPTWKELQPYTDSAVRLPEPAFFKRALAWGEDIWKLQGYSGMDAAFLIYDSISHEFSGNVSSALANEVPPWIDGNGNGLLPPLSGIYLDRKLRAAAAVLLREKRLGRRIQYVNFYPPTQEGPLFETGDEFRSWFDERFLPEKRAEAETAERIKAEYYIPWPLEFELFIKNIGGYGDGGFLDRMNPDEIVTFANALASEIRDTVKAHYQGALVAHLYNNYLHGEKFWNNLSFAGYDHIHFALFATCDSATTSEYIDSLSVHYGKVIRNSGNLPYVLEEVAVLEKYVTCTDDFAAAEKGVWQSIFNRVEGMSPQPIGISVDQKHIVSRAARVFVKDYIRSR